MAKNQHNNLWALVHAERAALADDLASLSSEQWQHETLCGQWNVEQVVAHLTAAASIGQWRWIRSMAGARFRPDMHNLRRLNEHKGTTPSQTLENFRRVVSSTVAPTSDIPAYLGEVVVHAQDIRQPLGLSTEPTVEALTPVAEFFASRNFAVPSKNNVAGLRLKAIDGPFIYGDGPLVTGPTLNLVMAMAGRAAYLDDLRGPGVELLGTRLEP
ncbi:uncharacterized protein (TIGR03083 family) [Arthrobacter stackebrandtii]|uniref:Uncharacterized protein (TIGR03083 family) n=1 Tax=Arthrobacter stackebrandtii TaxID=272161 RepID=A0ABS4YTP8_9MICC|nr:maleylpyruvate isomerase family mycothiol-dependent enzyme [Arthrobacter stackebrandtii]MBP2412178.1 uncharacterized protein (TIGR03083 family) [Arthrobacter stackebrandtii]PYH01971.1 hypothetical protein CVV67_00545 [Arthrobacter stackebrandtii]